MNSQYFEAMICAMMDERDAWREVEIVNASDALPETLDFCTPEAVGRLDAEDGLSCDPTRHGYLKLLEIEEYIWGWKDASEYLDNREPAIEDDHEWIRRGC